MLFAIPGALLYKNTKQNGDRHRFVLRYGVTLTSVLQLFRFIILVFHLKQKHEEGQRLLHYLQHTNTVLATGTFMYVINQKTVGYKFKGIQSALFTETVGCVS
jgi:hypothetical protein